MGTKNISSLLSKLINYLGVIPSDLIEDSESNSCGNHLLIPIESEASRRGYIIHPDCLNSIVLDWIKSIDVNAIDKSTHYFKRTWEKISRSDRFRDYMHAFANYAAQYSNPDTRYKVYGDSMDRLFDVNWNAYEVVLPGSRSDMIELIISKFLGSVSGSYLDYDEIECYCEYLRFVGYQFDYDILNQITDYHVLHVIQHFLNQYPSDSADKLLKLILMSSYSPEVLRIPQIINNRSFLKLVMNNGRNMNLDPLTDDHIDLLASVFNRYRKIFLAMRATINYNDPSSRSTRKIINKISRRAKKTAQVPYQFEFWGNLMGNTDKLGNLTEDDMDSEVSKITDPKEAQRYICEIKHRLLCVDSVVQIHRIRNGKMFISNEFIHTDPLVLETLISKLRLRIIELVKTRRIELFGEDVEVIVKLPDIDWGIDLAIPQGSDPKYYFGGTIPIGSRMNTFGRNFEITSTSENPQKSLVLFNEIESNDTNTYVWDRKYRLGCKNDELKYIFQKHDDNDLWIKYYQFIYKPGYFAKYIDSIQSNCLIPNGVICVVNNSQDSYISEDIRFVDTSGIELKMDSLITSKVPNKNLMVIGLVHNGFIYFCDSINMCFSNAELEHLSYRELQEYLTDTYRRVYWGSRSNLLENLLIASGYTIWDEDEHSDIEPQIDLASNISSMLKDKIEYII